jgi:hypothetical protein
MTMAGFEYDTVGFEHDDGGVLGFFYARHLRA